MLQHTKQPAVHAMTSMLAVQEESSRCGLLSLLSPACLLLSVCAAACCLPASAHFLMLLLLLHPCADACSCVAGQDHRASKCSFTLPVRYVAALLRGFACDPHCSLNGPCWTVVSVVFAGSTLVIGNNNQLLKVTLNAQGPISTAIA